MLLASIADADRDLIEGLISSVLLQDMADKAKSANMPLLIRRADVGLKLGFDEAFDPKVPELSMTVFAYQFWARWNLLQDNVGEAYLIKKGFKFLSEEKVADLDSAEKKLRNDTKANGTRQMRDLAKVIGHGMTLMNRPSTFDADSGCTAKGYRDARDQVLKNLKTAEGRTDISESYQSFLDDQVAKLDGDRKKLVAALETVSKHRAEIGLLEKNHDFGTKRPKKSRPTGLTYIKGQRA